MKSPKSLLIVLAVIVAGLFLATPALADVQLNAYEKQIVALINKERGDRGLHAVRVNAKLVAAAGAHSAEMGRLDYFSHSSLQPTGETWSSRIVRYGYGRSGYSNWSAGEDIYWGASLFSSPVACVNAWMASSQHRAVILNRTFRDIGVGAYKTDAGFRGASGIVWVFTLDMGHRAR
jgi:uncharacterized protein YkwD